MRKKYLKKISNWKQDFLPKPPNIFIYYGQPDKQAVPICVVVHQISCYVERLCPPNAPQPAKWWWSVSLLRHHLIVTTCTSSNPGKGWGIDQSESGIRPRDPARPMGEEEGTREQLPANPFCRLKGEIRLFISSCSVVTWGEGRRMNTKFEKWREASSCWTY